MDRGRRKCFWQRQNIGIGSHILLHRICQRLLHGRPCLEPHASCDPRLPGSSDIDGARVLLRQMAAAHHGEAVERMECIGKTVLADVLLLRGKVLTVAVHVRQDVHGIVLEHLVQFSQIRPPLLVEPAVADARHDEHAVVGKHPLMTDDLRGERLHHLDRVRPHPVAIVEISGHAKDDDIVLFLRPVHISALVRRLPAHRLHLLRIAGMDLDLA